MGHIYVYVHDLRSSGVVRNALTFAERFARDHQTTLVAGYADGFFRERAEAGPFRLVTLAERPSGRWPRVAAAWRLNRWLRGQPGGVLLSVGNMGHPTPYLACRGLRHVRRVYCISNGIARGDGLRGVLRLRWMGLLARDSSRIVLVGRALSRIDLFARALRTGLAVEIPNGVDLAEAARLAVAPVPHPWLDDEVPLVLGIGRLRPQKNFDLLIAAVGIARRRRRLRLAIIGGGTDPERARLQGLAETAGLTDDFLLAGETAEVFAWLGRSTVFALPSRWEGSSLVLLEALAVETPVVASRLAGDATQVLAEGAYGLLFDGEDAQALADTLLAQSSDAAIRPRGRAAAYAASISADLHAELVEQVLSEMKETGSLVADMP